MVNCNILTISPLKKVPSAKFLDCYNFQSALMLLNIGENVETAWIRMTQRVF